MRPTLDSLLTLARLGPLNLWRVGSYRMALRLGVHPVLRLREAVPQGPFFAPALRTEPELTASTRWSDEIVLFSAHHFPVQDVPDWHANPFRPGVRADATRPWAQIPDFDPALGDIKTVWECSRFEWLIPMAQRAALGNKVELDRLNRWLNDWAKQNPPYLGVNWKCGQEASIRVLHLATAAMLLRQEGAPLPGLQAMIRVHLKRIAPTMAYAIGQQNNHGTSEASALFIGGSWLAACGDEAGARWARTGRKWLEERARTLIEPDGTFSQYSMAYHRLMLDSFSIAETVRQRLVQKPFSPTLFQKLRAATLWLAQMVDPESGDAPNLGANDGARLIPLNDAPFRDFRPSLQLAAALFCDARAIKPAGDWDQAVAWLDVPLPQQALPPPASAGFDQGGMHLLRRNETVAYLRYPRFRFRPSQADALHLDLWHKGQNLLRDAGTFSYNVSEADTAYFNGTQSHNTAEFDARDQMPRLGRFLFGSWLRSKDVTFGEHEAGAGYTDRWGAHHHRHISLDDNRLLCRDRLSGKARNAVIRWRLAPGDWVADGNHVGNGKIKIHVSSPDGISAIRLAKGFESRCYLQKSEVPVLEVKCVVPCTLTTEISFS
jgi:hypothetical protein